MSAQLIKPKQFSSGCAIFGLLFLMIGLFIYLILYAAERDRVVYLNVGEDGVIYVRGDAIPEPHQSTGASSGLTRWTCEQCGYGNVSHTFDCTRCRARRPE